MPHFSKQDQEPHFPREKGAKAKAAAYSTAIKSTRSFCKSPLMAGDDEDDLENAETDDDRRDLDSFDPIHAWIY